MFGNVDDVDGECVGVFVELFQISIDVWCYFGGFFMVEQVEYVVFQVQCVGQEGVFVYFVFKVG